jgi:ribosomal protein S12 methylthiotransferase accessory factor
VLGHIPGDKVIEALQVLEYECLITRSTPTEMTRSEAAFWRMTGTDEGCVANNRANAACSVITLDCANSELLHEVLSMAGIRVTFDASFRFVVVRDAFDERLAAINRECLRSEVNWMLVRPYGRRPWIGPLFVPGQTPCWECLSGWLRINGWSTESVVAEWPPQTQVTLALAAIQAARWLLTQSCETVVGRIREFDSATLTFSDHHVLPSATCPYCASLRKQKAELSHTLSGLTGVTARIHELREWPGFTIYAGATSQVVGQDGADRPYYCRSQDTFGVAETSRDAKDVCLAEGVERYSVRFGNFEQIIETTHRKLGRDAVDPFQLTLDDESTINFIDEVMGWVSCISLISGKTRFVPAGLVYLSYDDRFDTDTNGCASGVSLQAATLSALLELIERDAVALWWYNRVCRPQLDLKSFSSRRIGSVLRAAEESNVHVELLDLTTDFDVPVSVAIANADVPGIAMGSAAHTDPEQCVWRALAEMSVGMTRLLSPPDGRCHWLDKLSIGSFGHLKANGIVKQWAGSPQQGESRQLTTLLERAEQLGLEVLRVDLTRPELQIPVVRVLVPGLRPRQRRLAPGRLYEVPLKLGWLQDPVSRDQMNPLSFGS